MKCPYICNIEQVNQNKYEFDEEGRNNFHEHKLVEIKIFAQCLKEECGAWRNDKCNFGTSREV